MVKNTKSSKNSNEEEVLEGKNVPKDEAAKSHEKDFLNNAVEWIKSFEREENIHKIVGILLLIIGLWQLRQWIFGLLFVIGGILFVTGYFEKNDKR